MIDVLARSTSLDIDNLKQAIITCEVIAIPVAQKLYRGTFEGEPKRSKQ